MTHIKRFNELFESSNNVHIEQDYADKEVANKIKKDKETQYKNQGWFFYQKDLLNPQAKNPPQEGWYDVKAYYGYTARTDIAYYNGSEFEKSKEHGLPDDQITHWKVRETDNKDFNYNKKTGKFKREN